MAQKISVITVVFNGDRYLEKTILSVINQEYDNIEYVVVDGGSTDNTLEILGKYNSNIDVLISEKDKGLSDAMNKGAKLATGDWLIYLHADDTFTDSKSVNKLVNASKSDPDANWITGYLRFQNSIGDIFRIDSFHSISWFNMILRNVIRHQSTMVKIDKSVDISFDEKYKYAMDYDYFLRLWKDHGGPKIIKEYISDFRLDGTNLSSDYYASIKDEMRVRINFRKDNKQAYKLIFDFMIFFIRYCKIFFIHNRKKC
jgi:glycosyltransferase involved in cell wall biosynthesis